MSAPPVFSPAWFARHQRPLLALLNAPVIGGELRSALAIRRHDVGGDPRRRIVRILPHAYIVANPDGTFTLDCRTHAKFAKRLYHGFYPIWRAMHEWDRFVAEPLAPALDFGFSTLTAFPDPSPETSTTDGYVAATSGGAGSTWATILAAAGTFSDHTSGTFQVIKILASSTSNQWGEVGRSIFLFDTSALSGIAAISSVVMSLSSVAGSTGDGLAITPNLDVYTSAPSSNTTLANADYGHLGSTSQTGSPMTWATWTGSGDVYHDFTFNATGIGNVSKTGISKFGVRNANFDVAAAAPTWASAANTQAGCSFAETTGTANDPKLVVTFILNVGGIVMSQAASGGMVGQMWQ
jgi:hypothetical protein